MHAEATEVKMTHNDHLQFLCEFGVLGFVLHAVFLIFLIRSSIIQLNTPKLERDDGYKTL